MNERSRDTALPSDPDRRRFLQQLSGAGLALGAAPLLSSCSGSDEAAAIPPGKEPRTYYFNLANARAGAEYFLVAGHQHHRMIAAESHHVAAALLENPGLSASEVTHLVVEAPLAAHSMQACYVKGVHGPGPADWHVHSMFTHVPRKPVRASCPATAQCAAATALRAAGGPLAAAPQCGPSTVASYFTQAADMIMHHPEIGSWDTVQHDYIRQTYVCPHPRTAALAKAIFTQGVATSTGGWATLVPATDADGNPILDTNGQQACYQKYSPLTLQLLGLAIRDILPLIKNDTSLGANVTGLSGAALAAAVQGKNWTVRNAVPSSTPSLSRTAVASAARAALRDLPATFGMTVNNVSGGKGYRLENENLVVGADRSVTFTVDNGFARYLGVYVRFLDGAGNPIALSSLDATTLAQFPITSANGTYDGFVGMCNQVTMYFGFPTWWSPTTSTYTVKLPPQAASMLVLSGGLGTGSQDYPETIKPGMITTAVMNLALPGLFLTMGAVQAFAPFAADVAADKTMMVGLAQALMLAIADEGLDSTYKDEALFKNVIPSLVVTFVKRSNLLGSAAAFVKRLWTGVAEGESVAAAEAATPFGVGLILQAVAALAIVAQITQTSVEVASSPWTYADTLSLTHSTTVTIRPDPRDTAGFPAVGKKYRVMAICDGASPRLSDVLPMPDTTSNQPLTYIFSDLPYGGSVTFVAMIYSSTGWIAGAGSSGAMANTGDTASITITENLVPLDATTQYSHRQQIQLVGGRRSWVAGAAPPAPATSCGNAPGSLCQLVGITVSEPFGVIGYSWQASSSGVSAFGGGGGGQLYQFANISFTGDPQSGYMFSGSGFLSPARVAYSRDNASSKAVYLDTSGPQPVVRRVNLTGVGSAPTFDGPSSNRAIGRLNFPSDALLVHSNGSIISFNSTLSKMEVLQPSALPVDDASAPLAVAMSGPGQRDGLINGPVLAAIAPDGSVYVLEQNNARVQAFDTAGAPHAIFPAGSTFPLKDHGGVTYLDMAVEAAGYVYVLLQSASGVIMLDIYDPRGNWLSTTSDVRAGKIGLDLWRNAYMLNYQPIIGVSYVEPSISQWIPSTP